MNHWHLLHALFLCTLLLACSSGDTGQDGPIYREQHRPQLHFSPPTQWMNDPNGMVFYEGEYHLFYQHYPDSNVWGPMHWGHAVSTDLIHWEQLPIALYPDSLGYIFSGSAVVDWLNTSGFGENEIPPLVAIYTYHDPAGDAEARIDFQTQGIAYSNDRGRTWTKYEGNPVLPNPGIRDFRDPKVIWDRDAEQWVMVLAAYDHVKFYGSKDLKNWRFLSDFGKNWGSHGGVWECPDLFPMELEGSGEIDWVLLLSINPGSPNGGSGTQYFVGDWDGRRFRLDAEFEPQIGTIPARVPEGAIFADFENGYADWTTTGTAFGTVPASGSLAGQSPITGYNGQHFVNSYRSGESATGTLSSPEFTIEKNFLSFKIAGSNQAGNTMVNLLVDGEVTYTATGNNSGRMIWTSWDISEHLGKQAQIQLVDNISETWGYICADQFFISDEAVRPTEEKAVWLDYGRDNYAGVTWSDVQDERRIFMGWMSNWDYAQVVPTEVWRSAMTLPRVLKLENTAEGPKLFTSFPEEVTQLRGEAIAHDLSGEIEASTPLPADPRSLEINLRVALSPDGGNIFGFELTNRAGDRYRFGLDQAGNTFFSDRRQSGKIDFSDSFASQVHYAPRSYEGSIVTLRIVLDAASIEVIADDGATVLTDIFFPQEDFTDISLFVESGAIDIQELELYPLRSIW